MAAQVNIPKNIYELQFPSSSWTLILSSQGIHILPSGSKPECIAELKGDIIQIPEFIVTGSQNPVSQEFIRKVKECPFLDLSTEEKRTDMQMSSNYWYLIQEALNDTENTFAESEAITLCRALMKFCERQYSLK